ncbi:hypothetical protein [Holospora curviuscula]|uniref:Uncharacterized protein n=1 Tax=Holospora curviuscula TaxID=1082868 RepID=A0A2S5R8Q4_9PROT|nr:hypothetical protein [Holospora curviuscula]PPE03698.1 hypothetical protein HCUR_00836 [Holospora curviuscula]
MQEKTRNSPENESIDEILESIKGLVYPVIDLNRPLKEESTELSGQPEQLSSPGLASEEFFPHKNSSAAQAISSFIHSVRREKQEEQSIPEVKKELLKNASLETFLTEVVQNALTPHIRSILEREIQNFLNVEGKNLMDSLVAQWFELHGREMICVWLEKHAPTLVVRCVEVYLQKLSR